MRKFIKYGMIYVLMHGYIMGIGGIGIAGYMGNPTESYTEIDGECYYQSDLDVLQIFIDNSQEGENPPPSDLSPIELGEQEWEDGIGATENTTEVAINDRSRSNDKIFSCT